MMKAELGAATTLTKEETDELRENFDYYDPQKTGRIRREDLADVLKRVGYNFESEELSKLEDTMDYFHTGSITFDDFLKGVPYTIMRGETMKAELIEAFKVFDRERTGYICTSELVVLLSNLLDGLKLSEVEIGMLVKEADADGDGQINYYGFAHELVNSIYPKK